MALDNDIELLNDAQKEAVYHLGSPLLILAGPGSGKTRVITIKIAWLIQSLLIRANSVLAMTFTNKAAKEMQLRIQKYLYTKYQESERYIRADPYISTFHSFGAHLLRRFHNEAKLKKSFQIYDTAEQLALLKEANPSLDAKSCKIILAGISKAKDYGITSDASPEELEEFVFDNIHAYRNYEVLKERTGNLDFGDLLIKPYHLLRDNKNVSDAVRKQWEWFFVDEYQDTNTIQGKLMHVLCKHSANLTVVGDDDQSIYGFRGAILDNILYFENHFPSTKKIVLAQNYRSTSQIVSLANNFIAFNTFRHGKQIFSENNYGTMPTIIYFQSEQGEEQFVVAQSKDALTSGETIAVFYRINSQSRGYEIALRNAHVPYEVVGSVGFFERMEVKDSIALLRLFKNPHDIVSFVRIANKPRRGIGKTTMQKISECMNKGETWMQAWNTVKSSISTQANKGLHTLQQLFDKVTSRATSHNASHADTATIGDVIHSILIESNLMNYYREEDPNRYKDRIQNLQEFISFSSDYKDAEEDWDVFFEKIGLNEGSVRNENTRIASVKLITLHRSKGLEFDRVIICGVENNLIPMLDSEEHNQQDALEEERRLFYVGITRAKSQLYITTCNTRKRYGRTEFTIPSPFLDTIDKNLVQIQGIHQQYGTDALWNIGDRVKHSEYGNGYVTRIAHKNTMTVIHVEFDNEYIATFIPQYSQDLHKVYE